MINVITCKIVMLTIKTLCGSVQDILSNGTRSILEYIPKLDSINCTANSNNTYFTYARKYRNSCVAVNSSVKRGTANNAQYQEGNMKREGGKKYLYASASKLISVLNHCNDFTQNHCTVYSRIIFVM